MQFKSNLWKTLSSFSQWLELETDPSMCINTWQHLTQCLGICGSNKVSYDKKCDGWVGTCLGAGGNAKGHS